MTKTHYARIRQSLVDTGFHLCKKDDRWHVCYSSSNKDVNNPIMSSKYMGDLLHKFEKEVL